MNIAEKAVNKANADNCKDDWARALFKTDIHD